jgi:adenosylcobyric acid synthase
MKSQGLVEPVIEFASRGKSVVGICGGFQMLCRTLSDPLGSEGGGEAEGLGLLRGETIFSSEKRTLRSRARTLPGPGPFSGAEGIKVEGYEVRMGRTTSPDPPSFVLDDGEGEGARNTAGNVWGTYLHGVFDLPQFRRRWLASLGKARFSGDGSALSDLRNRELDRLADGVEASVDMKRIDSIVGV